MIALVKYNAGNLSSVRNALSRLGCECLISDDASILQRADKVIFPGVGEASSAMRSLRNAGLDRTIPSLIQPTLGICLGLQLMCQRSEEGNTDGLGLFDTEVKRFPSRDIVPHMGWNNLSHMEGSLFQDIQIQDDVYFVHSYYAEPCDQTVALGEYIVPFSASLQKDNFYATQFHPEKSGPVGEQILKNFLEL
ncbi:imidazole glycerol phosphate synthase subunit HisH [bacterium SCSIO 12741]|nr:imidazole glycerol phosphate synthase subunit HisH [bacterium SCSIO 12741]